MATTLEELKKEVDVNKEVYRDDMQKLRIELNAMQQSIILAQGAQGYVHERGERGEGDGGKAMGYRIRDAQHLIPNQWGGEKDGNFADLAHDILTYMTMISDEAKDMMTEVVKREVMMNMDEFDDAELPHKTFISNHLYATLSKIMKGEPKSIIRNAQRNGISAWHRLHTVYDPRTTTDASVSIQRLINPQGQGRGDDKDGTGKV